MREKSALTKAHQGLGREDTNVSEKSFASKPGLQEPSPRKSLKPDPLMLDGERQNINISAYRVLYIMLLLVQKKALSLVELNQFLYENPLIERTYNNETITKYINTLRRVGCVIPKSTSKTEYRYCLTQYPFPIRLELETLSAVYFLLDSLSKSIDESLQRRALLFFQHVAWMLVEDQKQALLDKIVLFEPQLSSAARKRLIQTYQAYCKDALALEIEYQSERQAGMKKERDWRDGNGKQVIEPLRVLQEGQGAYLLAKDRARNKSVQLKLEKILSARQLPDKVTISGRQTSVVFQLYDRLARTYRPYAGEEVIFSKGDMIQVRTMTDNIDALLARLLKYNTLCQVISPLTVRQTMKERIQRLIKISKTPE